MMEIIVNKGKFKVPDAFRLSENKRFLRFRTPRCAVLERRSKDGRVVVQRWKRSEDKEPFVPENHVEVDGVLFRAVHIG